MSILVTGGAGYIGSVTVDLLRSRGRNVVVLDNLSRGHRETLESDVPFYLGDVGNQELVARIVQEENIQSCIHFAAFAYVGESVTEPARYYENNVEQGIKLIRSLLTGGVRRIVFSSTCSTYGEPQQNPISESHPQRPTNPYGFSKFFIERILESYAGPYDLRFVALRYFNAAGATMRHGEHHDPEPHLIPNVLAVAQGRSPQVAVFGDDYPTADGTPVRDYIHVADLALAHVLALNYLSAGGPCDHFNLGSGQGHSVLEVIETARMVTNRGIPVKIQSRRPGDPSHLVADSEKARKILGWQPTCSDLESIIRTAWDWHLTHPLGYSSR